MNCDSYQMRLTMKECAASINEIQPAYQSFSDGNSGISQFRYTLPLAECMIQPHSNMRLMQRIQRRQHNMTEF